MAHEGENPKMPKTPPRVTIEKVGNGYIVTKQLKGQFGEERPYIAEDLSDALEMARGCFENKDIDQMQDEKMDEKKDMGEMKKDETEDEGY